MTNVAVSEPLFENMSEVAFASHKHHSPSFDDAEMRIATTAQVILITTLDWQDDSWVFESQLVRYIFFLSSSIPSRLRYPKVEKNSDESYLQRLEIYTDGFCTDRFGSRK